MRVARLLLPLSPVSPLLFQMCLRLHARLALLVNRLGLRCSDSFQLPFRLTHDRFGELIGATRVTTTRVLSKWRQADLVEMPSSEITMRLAPALIESSPLTF